jgi:hypothetical protein
MALLTIGIVMADQTRKERMQCLDVKKSIFKAVLRCIETQRQELHEVEMRKLSLNTA